MKRKGKSESWGLYKTKAAALKAAAASRKNQAKDVASAKKQRKNPNRDRYRSFKLPALYYTYRVEKTKGKSWKVIRTTYKRKNRG